jgi:hypothetical protein
MNILIQGVKSPYWDIYFSDGHEIHDYTIVEHIHENTMKII